MKTVVIYGREGCCLCEQAAELLERVRATQPFALEQRDIEASDDLFRAYLERIPVVTIDGVEAFELFVDEAELRRLLEAPAHDPAGGSPAPPAHDPAGGGLAPPAHDPAGGGLAPPAHDPAGGGG